MTTRPTNINGDPDLLLIDRAMLELRRGRAIALTTGDSRYVLAAAEIIQPALLERMRAANKHPRLVLTSERASALGLPLRNDDIVVIRIADTWTAADLRALAGSAFSPPNCLLQTDKTEIAERQAIAGVLRLIKYSQQLPAMVWLGPDSYRDESLLSIELDSIVADAAFFSGHRLQRVSEARVPLAESVDSRFALFRDEFSLNEHVAVVVGRPDISKPVPVRLHSACLTGDVFGSLRCDCGEQLRTAVARIAQLGGGVLLYLDQEGRGIGLANKLRAYSLQDEGLDTLDADQHLGFLPDERAYRSAALMLRDLEVERIELLTNNPQKIESMREHGIIVAGRQPLIAATTEHNERYLRTKRERAGHLAEESGS